MILLADYLAARKESQNSLSRRAGVLQQSINTIVQTQAGGTYKGCHISTAWRIIVASRAEPTPRGEWVELEDLVPEVVAARLQRRRSRRAAGA